MSFNFTGSFAQTSKPATKFIELPGRLKLEYTEQGDPKGVPVIFLHGYTDSWRSYEPVLAELGPSIRAIAISMRGHGDSDKPQNGYEISDMTADIAAFMQEMKLPAAVIVGHSMGATIAQRFVIDHPQRTLGLVLIGGFISYNDIPALVEFNKLIGNLSDPIDPKFIMEFQQGTIANPLPEAFFHTVCSESARLPAFVWKAVAAGFMKAGWLDELRKFDKPTLILWGDKDFLSPEQHQYTLSKTIPQARLVIYHNTGHALHWEQPTRFAKDLKEFMNTRLLRFERSSELLLQGLSELDEFYYGFGPVSFY
jgi:non-heme chloroperoxidase